jgi:hypothetical protein
MATLAEAQFLDALFNQLSNPGMEKQAIDAVNDFTRIKMREGGFYRRILPPVQTMNDELDRKNGNYFERFGVSNRRSLAESIRCVGR